MASFIAYGNIHQHFPFEQIPADLIPAKLLITPKDNPRVQQRHQCRRLAHFLLWQLLKITGKPTALLSRIQRTASGRPYFLVEALDFNISHSGDWVAVMLQINEEGKSAVGIDIELPKTRRFTELMAHFAKPAEIDWFHHQLNIESAFYRCWCLREAVLKSQGVGIVKLSEVTHLPENHQIFSDYCPQGELWFTDELPFYLACFHHHVNLAPQILAWNGKDFTPQTLNQSIHYRVNEK